VAKGKRQIPHYRSVRPGNPETGLRGTVIEQRGIRATRTNVFDDPVLSIAELILQDRDPLSLFTILHEAAKNRLKAAGEPSIDTVAGNKDEPALASQVVSQAVYDWLYGIMDRHGELSPVMIAARFLEIGDLLGSELKLSHAKWTLIFAYCDAWHWLHFEERGEHDLAIAGYRAVQGRSAGPAAKAAVRKARDELIAIECLAWLNSDKGAGVKEPKRIAAGILAKVNDGFARQGWRPYKEEYLRKVVSRLLPDILPRVTGQSRQQKPAATE
jgi:hypothetical protein